MWLVNAEAAGDWLQRGVSERGRRVRMPAAIGAGRKPLLPVCVIIHNPAKVTTAAAQYQVSSAVFEYLWFRSYLRLRLLGKPRAVIAFTSVY